MTSQIRLLTLLCLLALLGSACGSGGDPVVESSPGAAADEAEGDGDTTADDEATLPDGAPQELEVTLFGGPAELAGYQAMVDSFEAANPDVSVTLNPVASQDDLLAQLTTAFAGGEPPDIFLVNYLKYGQFASQGVLADVQPYIDDSDVISLDDFYEPPVEAFSFDDEHLTCMPQNISTLAVYYNADMFQAAGVDPPAEGWTWDDFLAAGQALTDADSGQYGIGVEPSLQRIAPFIWSAGGELIDDPAAPTTLTLDEPAARDALDFFLDLQLVHGVVPPDAEEQSLESEERFIDGRLGMYLNSRRSVPTLRESIDGFTWDVGPLPTAPGGTPTTVLHGDAYCMAADGNPDLAWRLIEHAMGVEGQEILAESGRTVPSRIDVANSPAFLEPDQPPASSQVFLDVIPTIRSLPHTATWSQMQDQVDSVFADTFYGRIDRDAGVEQMTATAEAVFGQGQ